MKRKHSSNKKTATSKAKKSKKSKKETLKLLRKVLAANSSSSSSSSSSSGTSSSDSDSSSIDSSPSSEYETSKGKSKKNTSHSTTVKQPSSPPPQITVTIENNSPNLKNDSNTFNFEEPLDFEPMDRCSTQSASPPTPAHPSSVHHDSPPSLPLDSPQTSPQASPTLNKTADIIRDLLATTHTITARKTGKRQSICSYFNSINGCKYAVDAVGSTTVYECNSGGLRRRHSCSICYYALGQWNHHSQNRCLLTRFFATHQATEQLNDLLNSEKSPNLEE